MPQLFNLGDMRTEFGFSFSNLHYGDTALDPRIGSLKLTVKSYDDESNYVYKELPMVQNEAFI